MSFDVKSFDVSAYNKILEKGLCHGMDSVDEQIEAAVCNALGLPHSDDPKCVTDESRRFKISINDSFWSGNQARAKGVYALGRTEEDIALLDKSR